MINLSGVEKDVVHLCQQVGEFIRTESENFDRFRIEQKEGFNNLVSYVDKESERKLVESLKKIIPGAGFIAEEGTTSEGTNDYKWIIDPLDGTTNFTHGLPPFAISIGLAKKEEIVLGVVYEVTRQEAFHASEGNSAYCNGKEIKEPIVKPIVGCEFYVVEDRTIQTFTKEKKDVRCHPLGSYLNRNIEFS